MSVSLTPADLGKRISVQYFSPAGQRSEAVGIFERAVHAGDDVEIHIRKRDDSLVVVPMRAVRFGKVVPQRRT